MEKGRLEKVEAGERKREEKQTERTRMDTLNRWLDLEIGND